MTGIFPNVGGVVVRDPVTNLPVPAPGVSGVLVPPVAYDIDCDMTALPNDCKVAPENRQVNAIISEMLNLAAAMDPDGSWECAQYDNLSDAFKAWVAEFSGSQTGDLLCGSAFGNGTDTGDALLYCDSGVVKKLLIDGDEGLLQMVQAFLCDSAISVPNTNDDYFMYCRNGIFRKTQATTFQLYAGEWVQARSYVTNNLVRKNKKIYSPNANIPAGTAFVIGTTGATWYEVSATDFSEYDPDENYLEDAIIQYTDGKTYAANADIPAGTPFVIGTTGETWRLVDTTKVTILAHSATKKYLQYEVVTVNGLLYRTGSAVGPAAFSAVPNGPWALIGGERQIYQGDWDINHNATTWRTTPQNQYLFHDVVMRQDKIWHANADIPLGAAFTIGTSGPTWKELSASAAQPLDPEQGYPEDSVIQYDDGKYYAANADIPPGTPFVIGISGQTWRLVSLAGGSPIINPYDKTKGYAARELVTLPSQVSVNGDSIARAKIGGAPIFTGSGYDATKWDFIGERSKYRGRWQSGVPYSTYDVVGWETFNGTTHVMEMFWAPADIAIGAGDGLPPDQRFIWEPMDRNRGNWFPTRTYWPGDRVWYQGSWWTANGTIALGAAFSPGFSGNGTWRNDDFLQIENDPEAGGSSFTHYNLNKYNIFDAVAPKSMIVPTNASMPFIIGTVITGVSVGGQLTIIAAGGVTVRTPRTLLIRNGNYAAFTLTKVATNEWHLAGDLA